MSTMTPPTPNIPRIGQLDRATALRLAAEEYSRFVAQLRALDREDWQRATDCPDWDVRALVSHVLGMAEMVASLRGFIGQNIATTRAGGGIDARTALQVRAHAEAAPQELVDRFAAIAPRTVRGRARLSRLVGRLPLPEVQMVGGRTERWRLGFLFEVILTRDTWMHRVDVARATGRELTLTPDHDGQIVADAVAEWAQRHGRPYHLTLTGPAGGSWSAGADGPDLTLDAIEFCRLLSGRGSAAGLLSQQVPF